MKNTPQHPIFNKKADIPSAAKNLPRISPLRYGLGAALLFSPALIAQQVPSAGRTTDPSPPPVKPATPDVPAISPFTPSVPTTVPDAPDVIPARSQPTGFDARRFWVGPYSAPKVPPLFAGNGDRLRSLVRDGKLYLSERDTLVLAIENNLDVEIERYNLILADTDRRRAAGGGNLRGIDYTIQEPPNGVGGPGSPLLNTTATNPNPTTPTVTDITSLNATMQLTTNLSAASTATAQYSAGPNIPLYDPNIFFEGGYLRRSDSVSLTGTTTSTTTSSSSSLPNQPQALDYITADLSYVQGFKTGAQLTATANNDSQVIYGSNSSRDPFSRPSTSVTLTQPLLRGNGKVNLRFIRIAQEDRKISRLLFQQQVLETIYGASRIYYDLVSLGDNVSVKQDALRAARKLESDDQAQVDVGTLAPIELTRVKALVSSSEFDLIQAQGLYRTQEVILRNLILRADSPIFNAGFTEIVPTDRINVPSQLDPTPVPDLIQKALAQRPDLAQSYLQIKTGLISASGSANQAKPQLNVYANVQTRGVTEQAYEQLGTPGTAIPTLPTNFSLGGLRVSTIYQAGVQLNLPLRNRVAESDAARDQAQVRQVQARTEKLEDQIRVDIESAHIALETSLAAYKAALASEGYQEQLLQAERDRLEFAQSTPLNVLQDQAFLSQARSTEIAARSNYQKALIELDRSLGDLLEKNGITLEDSVQGQAPPKP